MRSLKQFYHLKWNDWLINSPKSFTDSGNLKSPGYATAVKWISEIWEQIDSNILYASFDQCGITSNNPDNYHHQLKHYRLNNELVEDTIPGDSLGDEDNFGFNQVDGYEYGEDLPQINSDEEEMDASEDDDE